MYGIYFDFASISKNQSSHFRGFTVCVTSKYQNLVSGKFELFREKICFSCIIIATSSMYLSSFSRCG